MLVKKHEKFYSVYRTILQFSSIKLIALFLTGTLTIMNGLYTNAIAASVTLAWDSGGSNVAGYNLYYSQCQPDEECTNANKTKNSLEVWPIKIDDINNPSAPQYTLHNLSDIHKYVFALTAYASSGQESGFSNEVSFTPPNSSPPSDSPDIPDGPANQPPMVDAGKDHSIDINLGKTILAGIVSDDGLPENGNLTYRWYLDQGPGSAEFDNPSQLTTSVGFDRTGTYTIVLEANDGQLTESDSITIDVYENTPPPEDNPADNAPDNEKQTIVIDNRDTDSTLSKGNWQVSCGTNPHAADSVWARKGATFIWQFISPSMGIYDLSIWWTYHNTRSDSVPISIETNKGVKQLVINQQKGAGKWVSLGRFTFDAGESYKITMTAPDQGSKTTNADAIKLSYLASSPDEFPDEPLIIDNLDVQNTVSTGTWKVSSGKNPYADNSVYGQNGATFTWSYASPDTGVKDVFIWWTYHSTRSTAVPVSIESESGVKVIKINQQQNAGKWVKLGQYKFLEGHTYDITLKTTEGSKTICADAVKIYTPQD